MGEKPDRFAAAAPVSLAPVAGRAALSGAGSDRQADFFDAVTRR